LFGVLLPPKKKPIAFQCVTLRFVLTGIVPSKKNRTRAGSNLFALIGRARKKRTGANATAFIKENMKLFIRSAPEHIEWAKVSKPIVLQQAAAWSEKYHKHGIMFPLNAVSMKIYHYWADNAKRDNSNKADTIADLLVDAGILSDDSWQVLNPCNSESGNYHGQILDHITTIDLTVRLTPSGASASSPSVSHASLTTSETE